MSHFSNLDIQRRNLIKEVDALCEDYFKKIAKEYDLSVEEVADLMEITPKELTFIKQ